MLFSIVVYGNKLETIMFVHLFSWRFSKNITNSLRVDYFKVLLLFPRAAKSDGSPGVVCFVYFEKSPPLHGDVTRITNVLFFSLFCIFFFAACLDDGHVYDHIGAYVNFCFVCNLLKKKGREKMIPTFCFEHLNTTTKLIRMPCLAPVSVNQLCLPCLCRSG